MSKLKFRKKYLLPIVVAAVMSFVSSRYLFVGSGLNLIAWGLLALCWGLLAKNKSEAWQLGAIYGFSQSFLFLWIDKAGHISISQFFVLLVIITGLSLLAAAASSLASRLSYSVKKLIHGKHS